MKPSTHTEHDGADDTPTYMFGDQERKDILELDALSDACLTHNFGYGPAGIENLRDNAETIRAEIMRNEEAQQK